MEITSTFRRLDPKVIKQIAEDPDLDLEYL